MEKLTDNERYLQAKARMEQIKGFYWHLFTYLFMIPLLAVVNYLTTDFPWVIFPALGWGVGLSIHWFAVFMKHSVFGKQWEERKIKEFMEEDENEQKQLYN